ncbi:MAG: multidrug efflux pump subunit AcrB [Limisphaerales bacterium]|jgi:multidrug efflux pump subunit AcrB
MPMVGEDSQNSHSPIGGVLKYFAANLVAANLLMALLLIGGFVAASAITAQSFPTIDLGTINITVPYPGATPSEVEESITRRIEEAVIGIDGVKRVTSRAYENSGAVSIELKDFVDEAKVRDDVETAIERLADFPPEQAEEPDIVRLQTIGEVMTLVVSSNLSDLELRRGAEQLEQELLAIPSVSLVSLFGAKNYEISIEVKEETLRNYGLSMGDVASAVRRTSLNLTSGEIRTDAGDVLLRTNNKRYSGEEFEDIIVQAFPNGTVLRLGDIAIIRDGFTEDKLIHQFNGKKSLFVKVQKSDSEDSLSIARDIRERLAGYTPPRGIEIDVWEDSTESVKNYLSIMTRNGVLGFVLVFLFLVLILDLRLATWVAMGVPIAFFGAFLFFDAFGVNFHVITLLALIIVLGIVVDDAVVVGENVIAEQERGLTGIDAAIAGINGVAAPVTVGVLTTIAAFAPLAFVSGFFSQFYQAVPVVVVTVLCMSLLEAFLILPAHLTHGRSWSKWPLDKIQKNVSGWLFRFRDEALMPLVTKAVRNRKTTIALSAVFFFAAMALVGFKVVRFEFLPSIESTRISASLAFPVGTPFEITQAAAQRLVQGAKNVDEASGGKSFRSISMTVGGQTSTGGGPFGGGRVTVANHLSSIQIQLNPEPIRTLSAKELEKRWREEVGPISGVEKLNYVSQFFGNPSDLAFELTHQDEDVLAQAVEELKVEYAKIPALFEVQDSNSPGKRQYDIELTPAGVAAGLSPADVAVQLRHNFYGEEVQRIQRGREELRVMVRYPEIERQSARDFFNVRIRLADGTEAPITQVAKISENRSYSSIERVNGRRIVTVSGRVDRSVAMPEAIKAELTSGVLAQLKDKYSGLQINEAGFAQDQSDSLGSLARLSLLAMLVIYALLASLLRSYTQPLIILAGVPFGAAGAFIGHFLLGYNLSFYSLFGVVALSGVVVNDSLILVDRFNKFMAEGGHSVEEAVLLATQRRFRPIFLTTATTSLGLMPLIFETSTTAQFMIPMAISLATGILFASLLILFVVPTLIVIREQVWKKAK